MRFWFPTYFEHRYCEGNCSRPSGGFRIECRFLGVLVLSRVFYPAIGVCQVQMRSFSSPILSAFRILVKPSMSQMGFGGITWMMPSSAIATSFCTACFNFDLISSGMTTWYFEETTTVAIVLQLNDSVIDICGSPRRMFGGLRQLLDLTCPLPIIHLASRTPEPRGTNPSQNAQLS